MKLNPIHTIPYNETVVIEIELFDGRVESEVTFWYDEPYEDFINMWTRFGRDTILGWRALTDKEHEDIEVMWQW